MRDRPPPESAARTEAALVAEKAALRIGMRERRRRVTAAERAEVGARVAGAVIALPEFARAERVAAYAALADEVPTDSILDAVLASGRVLLLPRVVAHGLEFAAVGDRASLRRGRLGILEPAAASEAVALAPGDLVLVPGVAFDPRGHRLGRGGGYYDRAFERGGERAFRVGIAFAFQLLDAVPVGPCDRLVDAVVTEAGVVRAARAARDPRGDPG